MDKMILISFIISFLNGIIFFLSICHFKLKTRDFLVAGLVGNASYILYEMISDFEYFGYIIFARMLIWTFFASMVYKRNHPEIRIDYVLFRINIIIILKLFFEKIIFNNLNIGYQGFYSIIYSWLPLILIGAVLDKEYTENLQKKDIQLFTKY